MVEPLDGPYVKVGLQQIYDRLLTLIGRVDTLIAQHENARDDLTDHEQRIRALERARWPIPSLAALVSLASLAVAIWAVLRGL